MELNLVALSVSTYGADFCPSLRWVRYQDFLCILVKGFQNFALLMCDAGCMCCPKQNVIHLTACLLRGSRLSRFAYFW